MVARPPPEDQFRIKCQFHGGKDCVCLVILVFLVPNTGLGM